MGSYIAIKARFLFGIKNCFIIIKSSLIHMCIKDVPIPTVIEASWAQQRFQR